MNGPAPAAYSHNGNRVTADAFYAVACDPQRSVAVEACAGAGKTWMLVSRIVRALLEGLDGPAGLQPQQILAITFTRRAAGEMRQRLDSWLRGFALADPAALDAELRMRGVADGSGARAAQLALLYQSVLGSGREVQIRTFHSWFAALLRSAPLALLQQLELPLHYELLEDDEPARALVWRRFYAALAGDAPAKADFEAVVLTHGRFQAERALQAALVRRIEFALADGAGVLESSVQPFGQAFPELAHLAAPAAALEGAAAAARWGGWAAALAREANKTPQKAAQAIGRAFADAGLTAPETAVARQPGPDHALHGAAAAIDAEAEPSGVDPAALAQRLALLRRALFVLAEDRLTQHLQRYPAAQEAAEELALLLAGSHQHEAWEYQQRMTRLSRMLLAEYAALKREHGWVDMNDVERAAGLMLSDPVLSGWVQQRLDAQLRHLLIDEFQDTNPLQWQALRAWLSGYAGAGAGPQRPSVFIVGDPKQSIYRFRRAEPQVFRAAQRFIAEGLGGDLLACDHTWRNSAAVLATVNATMGAAAQSDGYDGFCAHTSASRETGLVARLPAIARPERAAGGAAPGPLAEPWRDSLRTPREEPEDSLRMLEARQAAQWIAAQLAAGVLEPGDVMVLARKRAALGPMRDALRALQIPAQIGEKTELIECCEVQDVVALLDVLVSTGNDLALARALRSPLFGVGDAALVQLALARQAKLARSWFGLLQSVEPSAPELQGVAAQLLRWQDWLEQLPPHDALQAIYHDADLIARFVAAAPVHQRDVVLRNLQALLDVALQLGGGRFSTPYAFVRALKAGGVKAPAAANAAAVQLLTIHGAKGLEARAVLLLDTDSVERSPDTMAVLVDWPGEAAWPHKLVFLASESRPPRCALATLQAEQRERQREELNALYVALTRARHTLLLSSIEPYREGAASWWQRLAPLVASVAAADAAALAAPLPGAPVEPAAIEIWELPMAPDIPAQPAPFDDTGTGPASAPAGAATAVLADSAPTDPLRARIGEAMHRLLEWGAASAPNVQAAGREFGLAPEHGALAGDMARRILGGAGAWVWDSTLLAWQGNEVELMYQGETLRLDRLVQHRESLAWWVLDYKSGTAPLARPELVQQLQQYRDAVQEIYAGSVVHAAFLTPDGAMLELPPGPQAPDPVGTGAA